MTVKTIPGVTYVVSAAGECSVTAMTDEGTLMTLAQVRGGGQKAFQAIGGEVEVSDASAVVLPFVDAPVPLGMEGGSSAAQVAEMVESALHEFVPLELDTPEGTANATCQYIELDPQHVPQGRLVSVSLLARSGNNPATHSYLALWELGEDGETWSYLGSSTNAPGQVMNRSAVWEFEEGICLSGRKLRLLAQAERSGVWGTGPDIGVRTSSMPEGDETRCYRRGQGYAFLPQLVMAVQQPVPKFAEAGHAADEVAHLSQQEHEWLSGLQGGSQEVTAPALVMRGAQGNSLLVMRGNETNVSVSGSQLSLNVPRLTMMSDCPALYRYDAATGVSEVWLAGASDATLLAPLGITEAGTHVGAPSLPLCLRGSELRFNGEQLDDALQHRGQGDRSIAIGDHKAADGADSIAIGHCTSAHGGASIAIGLDASAMGDNSVAIGHYASVRDSGCVVLAALGKPGTTTTQLFLIPAGSELSVNYLDGEAGLGYAVHDAVNFGISQAGCRKLSELLTDHSTDFTPTGFHWA